MTALDDPGEDDLPTAPPPTLPPDAVEHFLEPQEAPTEPPPPPDPQTIANIVIAGLKKQIADEFKAIRTELGGRLDRLQEEVLDVRTRLGDAETIIGALDRGITSGFTMLGELHSVMRERFNLLGQRFDETAANLDRIADAIGPRHENQPPLFEGQKNLARDLDILVKQLVGEGASIVDLQTAERRSQNPE